MASLVIDDAPIDSRRKAKKARLIPKVYEVDPLECTRWGATLRIIALIDDADVIERILRHLGRWDPPPEPITFTDPDPPVPKGETLPLAYHPVQGIALGAIRKVPCSPITGSTPGTSQFSSTGPLATTITRPLSRNPG